jgi:hypothetical protein
MIQDKLQGVPVNVSASLIMNLVSFVVHPFTSSGKAYFSSSSYSGLVPTTTTVMFWFYSALSQPLD